MNYKSKSHKIKKSGAHLLNCGSCTENYVGHTGRQFEIRIKEHKYSYLKNNSNSHYATHVINETEKLVDEF